MRAFSKTYFFKVFILIVSGLLLLSTISLGYEVITESGKTIQCNDAANPFQCIKQQKKSANPANFKDQVMPLMSALPIDNGPLSVDVRYNTELKWILDLGYYQSISETTAMMLNLSGGPNELRGNLTAGMFLGDRSIFKATYEYLRQNLSFDFETGNEETWVYQNAVGAAFEYMPPSWFFHSVGVSGYGIFANSKDLSDVAFNETLTSYDVNTRHIAGGSEETGLINVGLTPTNMTLIALGGGYSHVSYDTQFEDTDSRSAIAYSAALTQLFSNTTKLVLGIDAAAADTESMIALSHIFPQNIEVGLKGQYYEGHDPIPTNGSLLLSFSYPAPKQYASFQNDQGLQAEFKRWSSEPVVYATRVLAKKDEKVKHFSIIQNSNPIANQTVIFGSIITPVLMSDHFLSTQDPGAKITYSVFTSGVDPTHNYTSDLNLALTPDGKNNAIFESIDDVEGVPAVATLAGPHMVTITATLTRPGLKEPITQSQKFTLTVAFGPAPTWVIFTLAPNTTTYGSAYTTNASLDTYVTETGGSGQYTFEINPAVSGFSIDSTNHLVSTKVPASLNPSQSITILVTDKVTLGGPTPNTFTLTIGTGTAPVFETTTISPALTYGNTTYPDIVLADLLQNPSENVSFALISQSGGGGCPNNLFTYNSTTKSLQYNTGSLVPVTCTSPYTIHVSATDNDTNGTTGSTALTVTINNGPIPTWTSSQTTLSPNGIYGQAYASDNLDTFVNTISGHSYTFTAVTNIAGTTLSSGVISAATLSNITTPTSATGSYTVCDVDGGPFPGSCNTAPQAVTLNTPIGAGPTFNNTVSLPNATIGSTYPSSNLDTVLLVGGVCPAGSGLCQWQIISQPGSVYTITAPNDLTSAVPVTATSAPSTVNLTLQVTNTVTGGSTQKTVTINQLAGTAPTASPQPNNLSPSIVSVGTTAGVYQSSPLLTTNFSCAHTCTVVLNSQTPSAGAPNTTYALVGSGTSAFITNQSNVLGPAGKVFAFNVTVTDNVTLGAVTSNLHLAES